MTRLCISWPVQALWQNRKVHHFKLATAKRAQRREAWGAAMEAKVKNLNLQRPLLRFTFHPPDLRKRDLHNMPATQKAAVDGIADALGVDDNGFLCVWPEEWGKTVPGGAVVIEIEETPSVMPVEMRGTIR